jgi:hypothetical protein
MIKLYFSHAQLKNKLNSDKLLEGKYFILDIKYIQKIKEFFDYNNLEKELNKMKILLERRENKNLIQLFKLMKIYLH